MTYASVRSAAEHIARTGKITPQQLAAFSGLWESMSDAQKQAFTDLWRAEGSPAAAHTPEPSWLAPALAIIREFEGCRLDAYRCPAGVWTIGWGSTRIDGHPVKAGDQINQAAADEMLRSEVERFAKELLALLPPATTWPGHRVAALISWIYNVGIGAAGNSTLRKRILNQEEPNQVIREELPRWNKADGRPLEGLTRRRAAEVALFAGQPTTTPAPKPTGLVVPAGMVGPRKAPDLKPGDHHLVANDCSEILTAYNHAGVKLWAVPCLCRGQGADTEWRTTGSDTPPGLYRVGRVYRDYEENPNPPHSKDRQSYGWYSFDLKGLEGQEGPNSKPYRDGIMIHGGGTACGWPGAWAPKQALHPTLGCIRLRNVDLRDMVLPLIASGTIWVSVLQEAP
jgi:GH24 family phage-related lysozyme (muramidase)